MHEVLYDGVDLGQALALHGEPGKLLAQDLAGEHSITNFHYHNLHHDIVCPPLSLSDLINMSKVNALFLHDSSRISYLKAYQ